MCVGHGDGLALQPFLELRITLSDGDMADGIPQGTLLTNDNADFKKTIVLFLNSATILK